MKHRQVGSIHGREREREHDVISADYRERERASEIMYDVINDRKCRP